MSSSVLIVNNLTHGYIKMSFTSYNSSYTKTALTWVPKWCTNNEWKVVQRQAGKIALQHSMLLFCWVLTLGFPATSLKTLKLNTGFSSWECGVIFIGYWKMEAVFVYFTSRQYFSWHHWQWLCALLGHHSLLFSSFPIM